MKLTVGQRVRFKHPSTEETSEGTIGYIDPLSGDIQLIEWKDDGRRTKWEPANRFELVK